MTLDSAIEDGEPDHELSTDAHSPLKEEGLRVPLPILFITLMILVILSVFDILEKSLDANLAANRRVAQVVLDGAINRADAELNDLALELVSDLTDGDTAAGNLEGDSLKGYGVGGSRDQLTIFFDPDDVPVAVFSDGNALVGRERGRFLSGLALQSNGLNERFVSLQGRVFMLSRLHELTGPNTDFADRLVVGLPASRVLIEELEHYRVFDSGSLRRLLDGAHRNGFQGLSGLIVELRGDEIGEFHYDVIAQVIIVLVAFIICVIIARRVDEKNDALRRSYQLLAEGKKAAAVERKMALSDPVTGIANRKAFDEFIADAVRDSAQRDEKFVLALFDLDDFKPINDSFGHLTGDEALRHVASTLEGSVRQTDMAARLGGDEFAVVLRDVHDKALAEDLISRILLKVAAPFEARGNNVEISISAGLSIYPDDAGTGEQIFSNADQALYAAKELGKNQLCSWPLTGSTSTATAGNDNDAGPSKGWISSFVKKFV